MLNISFLGKIKVEYNGKSITELLGNKTIALLCMLALNDKKYVSREKIIAYLWPDSNEDAAKYNLRFNLWLIKKNIGPDEEGNFFLCVDKESCAINEKYRYACDLLEIIRFKPEEKDTVEPLLSLRELFKGEFLEGCYFNNCEELNEFILFERINLEKKKVCILKRLAELYENQRQYDFCLEMIREIQEIEPYDEEIALKIMDLYAKKGNNAKAINYYNNFSNILASSLGMSPSTSLKKRYHELKYRSEENQEDAELPNQNKNLEILIYGIKGAKFFGVSQVIAQILEQVDMECVTQLREIYISDLWHIQRKINNNAAKDKELSSLMVPSDCNIINAFAELLKIICNRYSITIRVNEMKDLDEFSQDTLMYVKKLKIKGINITQEH